MCVVGHFNTNPRDMEMKYNTYEEAELACINKLIKLVEKPKL